MRFWLSYVASIILLTSLAIIFSSTNNPFSPQTITIVSPIPSQIELAENKQVTLLDLWRPFVDKAYGATSDSLTLTAHAALAYDLTTNQMLFEKNSHEHLPMASLTKIMTAIVALEHPKQDDRYIVRSENLVGEDSMGIQAGESFNLKELLYGLILKSGNDTAEVLASNYSEGRNAFVTAMNEKAKALGLMDTRFSNPSGLQGDGVQYTTAQDLLVMTKYALEEFPDFAEVSATVEHVIPANQYHQEYDLENETNLLTSYPGVKGVKTGYTPEAGLCLVTFLDYKGHRIIGILLNSENRREEMKDLLDYSLKSLSIAPPVHG